MGKRFFVAAFSAMVFGLLFGAILQYAFRELRQTYLKGGAYSATETCGSSSVTNYDFDVRKNKEGKLCLIGVERKEFLNRLRDSDSNSLDRNDTTKVVWTNLMDASTAEFDREGALRIAKGITDGDYRACALLSLVRSLLRVPSRDIAPIGLFENVPMVSAYETYEDGEPPPAGPNGAVTLVPLSAGNKKIVVLQPFNTEQQKWFDASLKCLDTASSLAAELPTSTHGAEVWLSIADAYFNLCQIQKASDARENVAATLRKYDATHSGFWYQFRRNWLGPLAWGVACTIGLGIKRLVLDSSRYYFRREFSHALNDPELAKALGVAAKTVRSQLILPNSP